jgi:hypothetical protein
MVIAEAAASRVVVELIVLSTPAEASRPEPVAVTTVVEAVAVVSASLKYATPFTKCELSSVTDVAYEIPLCGVPARMFAAVIAASVALVLLVVNAIVWFAPSAAPVFNVNFIKRPTVFVAPVTEAPVTVARVAVVTATPVAAENETFVSPAAYVAVASVGEPALVETKNEYEPATSGWKLIFTVPDVRGNVPPEALV